MFAIQIEVRYNLEVETGFLTYRADRLNFRFSTGCVQGKPI